MAQFLDSCGGVCRLGHADHWRLPNPDTANAADKPKAKAKADPEKMEKKLDKLKESVPAAPARQITIAKVDSAKSDFVQKAAARIDALVEANYKKHVSSESEPERRALYPPDLSRHHGHNSDTRTSTHRPLETQHARLARGVDRSTAEYRRLRQSLVQLLGRHPASARRADHEVAHRLTLQRMVRKSIETNMPYDKFVYEMLAATGKGLDNPATGYILRDANMPLDALNNTVRVFLGTQIGCAQCHDHPFDRWTQQEFYQMAAYTYGTTYGQNVPAQRKMFAEAREAIKKADGNTTKGANAKYRAILEGNLLAVADSPAKLKYPDGIDGTGVKAGEVVKPHAIFDPPITLTSSEPRAWLLPAG